MNKLNDVLKFADKSDITPRPAGTPFSRATRKHKNTFIVNIITFLCDYTIFNHDIPGMTCLTVTSINGAKLKNDTHGMHKAYFPNPGAARIPENFSMLAPVMGTKMACMIIEYLDKDSGVPVVTLFPNGMTHIHAPYNPFTFRHHLNHATRQDLKYNRELRLRMTEVALRRHQNKK